MLVAHCTYESHQSDVDMLVGGHEGWNPFMLPIQISFGIIIQLLTLPSNWRLYNGFGLRKP